MTLSFIRRGQFFWETATSHFPSSLWAHLNSLCRPSPAELISNGYDVVRVYTQPPRPSGRGKKLTKSPVHQFAEIMGIPVETPGIPVQTPESFRKPSVIDDLEALGADVACVVAYGQILPKRARRLPEPSRLTPPKMARRGPCAAGDYGGQTGVQIQQMDKGLDTGDILLSETVDIHSTDTAGILLDRLSRIGAGMWPRVLGSPHVRICRN